jgi:hypothetical protein
VTPHHRCGRRCGLLMRLISRAHAVPFALLSASRAVSTRANLSRSRWLEKRLVAEPADF